MTFTLGEEAVYAAQRCSRELAESVWSAFFYKYLLDVLENGTWREFTTEAFGRSCRFDQLSDFLVHKDGLGWPSLLEVLKMMHLVADCREKLAPEKNAPPGRTLQQWATAAIAALNANGITRLAPVEAHAQQMLSLKSPQFAQACRPSSDNPDIVRVNGSEGGNSAAYLAARLKKAGRDDLLEQIGPGKPHRSMRSAAIEAGIIKPVPTVRLVHDPPKVAAAIAKHFSPDEITSLCEALLSLSSES